MLIVLKAIRRAFSDLLKPRVMVWVVAPITCALIVWGVATWLWWAPLTGVVQSLLPAWFPGSWLGSWAAPVRHFFSVLLVFGMLGPLVMMTAVTVTALFVMPVLVDVVAATYYPTLERKRFGTVAGSVLNTAFAIIIYVVLWIITLPLWFTGIGALLAPMLNSALLNQRVFRYDALTDHASAEEYAAITKGARRRLFGLALTLSPFSLIPLANLFVPVVSGLAFTHLCLAELEQLRNKNSN